MEETLSTLKFASSAKSVRVKPRVNERITDQDLIRILYEENERLKNMLELSTVAVGQPTMDQSTAGRSAEQSLSKRRRITSRVETVQINCTALSRLIDFTGQIRQMLRGLLNDVTQNFDNYSIAVRSVREQLTTRVTDQRAEWLYTAAEIASYIEELKAKNFDREGCSSSMRDALEKNQDALLRSTKLVQQYQNEIQSRKFIVENLEIELDKAQRATLTALNRPCEVCAEVLSELNTLRQITVKTMPKISSLSSIATEISAVEVANLSRRVQEREAEVALYSLALSHYRIAC